MDRLKRSLSPSRRQEMSDALGELLRSVEPDVLTRLRTKMRSVEQLEQVDNDAEVFRFLIDQDIGKFQARVSRTAESDRKRTKALKQLDYSSKLRRAGYEAVMQDPTEQLMHPHSALDVEKLEYEAEVVREREKENVRQQEEQAAERHARLKRQMEYWAAEAVKQGVEARLTKAERLGRLRDGYQNILAANKRLRDDRDKARLRLQAEGPTLDPPVELPSRVLGVFGTHVQRTQSQDSDLDGHRSSANANVRAMDDVLLWSDAFDTRYDEHLLDLHKIETELQREEQLYSAVSQEMQILMEAAGHLENTKAGLQKDLTQQEFEAEQLAQRHALQPQQDISTQDIQAAHLRQSRIVSIKESLGDCEHAMRVSASKLTRIQAQEQQVAGKVAILRDKVRALKAEHRDDVVGLPTVVGRGIVKQNDLADTFMVAPRAAYDSVRLYSNVKFLQEEGKAAATIHADTKHFDRNLWLMRMKHEDYQQAFQQTLSKLVESSEKLAKSTTESKRLDVLAALNKFFEDDQQLQKVKLFQSGPLQWWKYRVPSLCKSVVQWSPDKGVITSEASSSFPITNGGQNSESNLGDFGISLGSAKVGFAMGVVQMPCNHLWQVLLTVTARCPDCPDGPATASDDRVVVKFGSALDSLQTIGAVHGAVNPETGTVAWDIYYQFKGSKLAFRFEFYAASETDSAHLAVLTGQYEQTELEPLQVVDYTKGRVRSSLVTEIEIEERQGKLQLPRLMEELINVEASTSPFWDSNLLNGVTQRYDRDMFLKLIRAEILLEHDTSTNRAAASDHKSGFGVDISAAHTAKLYKSEDAYRERKRKQQEAALQLATARIGKVIRIFHEQRQQWRFVIVRDCTVQWVDNKTKALVLYVVQEVNKEGAAISGYLTVDLEQTRYFEDASDQLFAQAIQIETNSSTTGDDLTIDTRPSLSPTHSLSSASCPGDTSPGKSGGQSPLSPTSRFSKYDKHRSRRERLVLAAKFTPETFALAVPQVHGCEHMRAKAWGTAYGKGIRCADCGKDLTELHDEPSQLQGFGTGGDEWLDKAVHANRTYDSTFKFDSSAQRELVEAERLRLEKERREMELVDDMFVDFKSLKVLYDFDQRHQDILRQHGVFRQGVQWTEETLTDFIKAQEEAHKKSKAAEGIMITAREARELIDLTDLPPSTFRAQEEARKVAYEEMKWVMMRIRGFQSRVIELTVAKTELIADHHVITQELTTLHSNAIQNNASLDTLGIDLQMSAKLLQMAVEIRSLLRHSRVMVRDAEHNEKLAELNFCGVQEIARTAKADARRLRGEVKALLKEQFGLTARLAEEQQELDALAQTELSSKRHFEAAEEKELEMMYCCPGHAVRTPFGVLTIREFRFYDRVLVVELPFCTPPAMGFIHSRVAINMERALQSSEMLGMEREDAVMVSVMKAERRQQHQEIMAMSLEDATMREWLYYTKIVDQHQKAIEEKVEEAVLTAHYKPEGLVDQYERQQETVTGMLKMVSDREKQLELWTGTGPRPKLPSPWQRFKLRRQLNHEIRCRRLARIASQAELEERQKLDEHQLRVLEATTTNALIDSQIKEFIRDVAASALQEGLEGTRAAELQSGIVFPSTIPMQYNVYTQLRDAWKARKEELRRHIIRSTNQQDSPSDKLAQPGLKTEEELRQELEAIKRAEMELARQQQLCEEMFQEEERSRLAWHTEAIRSVTERRQMAAEERLMRAYFAELKAMEEAEHEDELQDALLTNSNDYRGQQISRAKVNRSRARRREELMKSTVERRRQQLESEKMAEEDEFSKRMERYWKEEERARQAQKRAQMSGEGFVMKAELVQMLMENLEFPEHWDVMTMIQQNYWIETQMMLKQHKQRLQELTDKHAERMLQAQSESQAAWQQLFDARSFERWSAELAWMHTFEQLNVQKREVKLLRQNLQKLELLLQERGFISLKGQEQWVMKKHTAMIRREELEAARSWSEVCRNKLKQRKKIKRQIEHQCLWVDTTALSGFHQRYRTENLRMRIYDLYFQSLCEHIVIRTEIVATERQMLRIQEGLTSNATEMLNKTKGLQLLWREFQTDQMMRLRRSALGRKIFGKWQREIMRESFRSWARYLKWQRGDREAFQLKYQLLRNEIDIQKQYAPQLLPADAQPPSAKKRSPHDVHKGTLMKRHKERLSECANCGTRYLEGQNHSLSCAYHPGEFRVACPKSCENPGRTRQCVAHKRKRWSCCDESESNKPCSRRSHVPVPNDPVYDNIAKTIRERDKEAMAELDQQLEQVRQNNYAKQVYDINRSKLKAVEDEIRVQRQFLDKYKQLRLP